MVIQQAETSRRAALAGVIGIFLVGSACSAQLRTSSGGHPTTAISPSVPESLSPVVSASVDLGQQGTSIAVGEGGVWVRTTSDEVIRLDPDTAEVVATIDVGGGRYGNVAVGAGAVWVTGFDTKTLYRIDPARNEVVDEIEVGWSPEGLGVTRNAVWVANHNGGSLSRVDPKTDRVISEIAVGPEGSSGPKNIEILNGKPWTVVINNEKVVEIDPDTNAVAFEQSFPSVEGMFASDDTVFAVIGSRVTPVDAATQSVGGSFAPQLLPSAFGQSAFWTVADGDLYRLDGDSLEPDQSWHISQSPDAWADIAFDDGELWLLFVDTGLVLRVEPDAA